MISNDTENHMVVPFADDDAHEIQYCWIHAVQYICTCPDCDEFHEEHMAELAREVAEEQRKVLIDIAGTTDV